MTDPIRITEDADLPFTDALYRVACSCGARLSWRFTADPDGPEYHAECCGRRYHMFPVVMGVRVEVEK